MTGEPTTGNGSVLLLYNGQTLAMVIYMHVARLGYNDGRFCIYYYVISLLCL